MVKNVTTSKPIPDSVIRDMIVASICIKYTQSNSVGFAKDGMMVGVGAGQQSRVDCVKLAGRKVKTWYLRQHLKVLGLKFKPGVKRQRLRWETQFEEIPEDLTEQEKDVFMETSEKELLYLRSFLDLYHYLLFASSPSNTTLNKEVIYEVQVTQSFTLRYASSTRHTKFTSSKQAKF